MIEELPDDIETDIDDIETFRKVVYKENQDIVSSSYDVKAGEYILVPSDR